MIRTAILAAAALAAFPAIAAAEARPAARVTATWHPAMGLEGRYCIRATQPETAAMTGARIHQRLCHTERRWQALGVTFSRRAARPALSS